MATPAVLAQVAPPSLAPGMLLWAVFFGALGLALGAGMLHLGRRRPGPARLDAPASPAIPPGRVDAEQVDALLDGRLAGHRVVYVGPPRAGVIPCLDPAPLPRELVAAIERLAVVAGPPVALVVADPGRLDPPVGADAVDLLDRLVGGRFPLWVVGGPSGWRGLA